MTSGVSYTVRDLSKEFGGRPAVLGATMTVKKGTVHGVIGKNGAGKSVLMSMVAGTMQPSSGEIDYGDHTVSADRKIGRRAHAHGVRLISQEPPILPYLTVSDYLFLGTQLASTAGWINAAAVRDAVSEIDGRLKLGVRPGDAMIDLPIEVQQLLAFGKAVFLERAPIVLLDEITASLSGARRAALLAELPELAQERSFTLISHRISEIMDVCDTVTVMRDGIAQPEMVVRDTTASELAHLIVGATDRYVASNPTSRSVGTTLLEYRPADTTVMFSVNKNEIVGLAGIEGSGKDELLESLAGLRDTGGTVTIAGVRGRITNARSATRRGIAYLPKKREEYATIHNMSVLENLILPVAKRLAILGLWRERRFKTIAAERIKDLEIRPDRSDVVIDTLSGGNRQKVMIGRLQLMRPLVYLLNEPTRGIDIATKPRVLSIVKNHLAETAAVVMTSESEEELVECCDRILIFWRGAIVAELQRGDPQFTASVIYRLSQGITPA